MRVVITAGGTGGHIYPALAIIDKIKEKEPNSEFLYIGTHNRMEKDIVPERGIPFKSIEMYGFNKKNLLKNFKTVKCLIKGYKDCKKYIKEFNPDIVIGVGGYVTVPVIISAKKLGYKKENEKLIRLQGLSSPTEFVPETGTPMILGKINYVPEWLCKISGLCIFCFFMAIFAMQDLRKRLQQKRTVNLYYENTQRAF